MNDVLFDTHKKVGNGQIKIVCYTMRMENTKQSRVLGSKTALIVIDIQNNYFGSGTIPGHWVLVNPERAAANAAMVLNECRKEGVSIFHVQHEFYLPDCTEDERNYLWQNNDAVKPLEDEVIIRKKCPSSFLGTSLQDELSSRGIENLVVCGMMSHMCVDTTVRAAMDYGYKVTLISDACATLDLRTSNGTVIPAATVHETFMAALDGAFATLVTAHSFCTNKNAC